MAMETFLYNEVDNRQSEASSTDGVSGQEFALSLINITATRRDALRHRRPLWLISMCILIGIHPSNSKVHDYKTPSNCTVSYSCV